MCPFVESTHREVSHYPLPMGFQTTWLSHLHQLRLEAGTPSFRRIAAQSGYSHTQVTDLFKGTVRPGRMCVLAVAGSLTTNKVEIDEIINDFDTWRSDTTVPMPIPTPPSPRSRQPSADAILIADAIREAAAIIATAIYAASKSTPPR